jgi:hypothetical protein
MGHTALFVGYCCGRGGDRTDKVGWFFYGGCVVTRTRICRIKNSQHINIIMAAVVQAFPVDRAPSDKLAQLGRLEDKTAAKLIAGAAGVAEAVVWVTCEGGGAWFDKSDERRLMSFAWDGVIEKEINPMMDTVIDRMSVNDSVPRPSNQQPRLKLITETLKEFRQAQLSMRVESFSPSAEESMVGLVMGLCEDHGLFANLSETDRDLNNDPTQHHDDKTRRLVRMLRRLPITRNQFCRTAGCVLRYSLCLQEGSAVTTRRLNQIQSDMIRSKSTLVRYFMAHYDEISVVIAKHYTDRDSMYVFDWASHEMHKIDNEQFPVANEKQIREEAFPTRQGGGAYYTAGDIRS